MMMHVTSSASFVRLTKCPIFPSPCTLPCDDELLGLLGSLYVRHVHPHLRRKTRTISWRRSALSVLLRLLMPRRLHLVCASDHICGRSASATRTQRRGSILLLDYPSPACSSCVFLVVFMEFGTYHNTMVAFLLPPYHQPDGREGVWLAHYAAL